MTRLFSPPSQRPGGPPPGGPAPGGPPPGSPPPGGPAPGSCARTPEMERAAAVGTRSVMLTLPGDFQVPRVYLEDPARAARALTLGDVCAEHAADHHRAETAEVATESLRRQLQKEKQQVASMREQVQLLREQLEQVSRETSATAAQMAQESIVQARSETQTNAAALLAQEQSHHADVVRRLEEQLEGERARAREMEASATAAQTGALQRMEQQMACLTGCTRLKGELGEHNITQQVMVQCPDSTVTRCGEENHCGDGLWTRHFGTAKLSMHCMLEVKNVDTVRAEELDKFVDDFAARQRAGSANCAMFLSLRSAAIPASRGRTTYNAYCSLEWRSGCPVLYVSNVNSNPDLLGIAMATMQHVWQYCSRVNALGPQGVDRSESEELQQMAHVVNGFVNEQFEHYTSELKRVQEADKHIRALQLDADRRRKTCQAQVDNIAQRIADSLGKWVVLNPVETDNPAKKRRREGAAIPLGDLTPQQSAVVDACVAHTRGGGKLLSAAVNKGEVPGVRKYEVDSLFKNFRTLKLTVEEYLKARPAAAR